MNDTKHVGHESPYSSTHLMKRPKETQKMEDYFNKKELYPCGLRTNEKPKRRDHEPV